MTIGDALFARLALRGFSTVGAQIAATQERISSGVNDPRMSDNPARGVELSALRDMRAQLDSREGLAARAADRLAMTDETLGGMTETLRQIKEVTLRAANDTLPREAYAALRVEAMALRESLMAAANSADATGRPLFAGTAPGPAFARTGEGVVYQGDDGSSVAQLGDRTVLRTGLPGSQVFGRDGG